ncbi:Hypothetical predicted protein [Mytilus galloprovincialis]|uniref:BTB domain-containing protein n=2 Tax=Mytilus galloprovincialis TaxID=29158 RepID=A0A8B6C548_MYTGA|nr:Hypothetical predicted protein [Mytilus galloprovincialis]
MKFAMQQVHERRTISTKPKSSQSKCGKKMGKRNKDDKQSPLIALLPGAKIDSEKGKITVNIGISKETVIFNIGGVKFETYRSTLYRQPDSPLANEEFLQKHFRSNKKEYFFDRDPAMFKAILNYLRTGELHMPPYMCGPAAKLELEFWGIPDSIIERCCYTHYNAYNSTLRALNRLEKDRHGSFDYPVDTHTTRKMSKWKRIRSKASIILNHPERSKSAKVYGMVSLLVVAISILSFLAETHPSIQVKRTVYDVSFVYNATTNLTTNSTTEKEVIMPHPVLDIIDHSCMAFFTIEYILRVVLSLRRLVYVRSLMGIIDLFALLPDYIQLIMFSISKHLAHSSFTRIITILKITRILRIFRLVRHVPGLWILVYTLKASLRELLLMVAFLFVGMLIFSSLIYYVDDREIFTSIPHSFWWALITMTTVGYGDMYPVTALGYMIGSLTAMCGLLMIGFSVPILVNNFITYYQYVEFAIQDEKLKREKSEILEDPVIGDQEMTKNNNSYR